MGGSNSDKVRSILQPRCEWRWHPLICMSGWSAANAPHQGAVWVAGKTRDPQNWREYWERRNHCYLLSIWQMLDNSTNYQHNEGEQKVYWWVQMDPPPLPFYRAAWVNLTSSNTFPINVSVYSSSILLLKTIQWYCFVTLSHRIQCLPCEERRMGCSIMSSIKLCNKPAFYNFCQDTNKIE